MRKMQLVLLTPLWELAQAIGTEGDVELSVIDGSTPITVRDALYDDNKDFGVIQPLTSKKAAR